MAQLRSATQWLTWPVDEPFGDSDDLQDGLDTFVRLLIFFPPTAVGFLSCGSSTSQKGLSADRERYSEPPKTRIYLQA